MATAESVKTKIQNLIATANEATGNADTDLTTAVNSLIAGFGTGGDVSGIYMAKVTPAEDAQGINITHNLGTTDILLAACFVETVNGVAEGDMNGKAIAKFWAKTDIPVRLTSTAVTENYETHFTFNYNSGDYKTGAGASPTSESYKSKIVDANTFYFERAGSATARFYAGFTYTVIIMAASAFVGV